MADENKTFPGTDLKYKITFEDEGFDPAVNNWLVDILNKYHQKVGQVTKDECLIDTEGNFYITVRAESGKFYAKTIYQLPDGDYEEGYGQQVDIQPLYEAGCSCIPKLKPCYCEEETTHKVTFERVTIQNVDGVYILLDRDGQPILDRNGDAILVHKYKQEE